MNNPELRSEEVEELAKRLEAVARAAAPGDWVGEWSDVPHSELGEAWAVDAPGSSVCVMDGPIDWNEANATHVATFDPPTVLGLLARLRTLAAENARLREKVATQGAAVRALLDMDQSNYKQLMDARSESADATDRFLRMSAAAEPFARKLVDIGDSETDEDIFGNSNTRYSRAPPITVGDFRRLARAVRAAQTLKGEADG